MNKLKDVAGLLKAKITKDQLEEALINATSQQNWQASTHILHEIANAAYNYEKWQQINEFIWQKLKKGKSWRKILKTLNLVEFLLKNGPPSIISSFKYDIYQFRSFDNFSHYDDGIDRGESIRERAKAIVDLLSNEELLQEERVKAKTIRQRMSGVVSGSNYGGFNNKESSSMGSKYGSIDNKSYQSGGYSGSSSSTQPGYGDSGLGVYGDYSYQKSTLDKYKDTKPAAKKQATTTQSLTTPLVQDKKQPIIDNKKPFERIAPKLVKPGTKPVSKPEPANTTKPQSNSGNNNIIDDDIFGTTTEVQHVQKVEQPPQQYVQPVQQPVQQTVQQPVQQSSPFDLGFTFDTPATKPQPVQQPVVQQPVQQPVIQPQQSFHTPVQQPSLYQQPTQNTFGMNLTQPTYGQQPQYPTQPQYGGYPQPQPYQQPNQFNMMGGYQQPQQGLYGYNPQPQQPFNAYTQPYQQPGHFPQQPQTWPQQQPLTLSTPTPPQNLGPISLQTTTTHSKKDEDEFGNFSSGQNNNVKWLTSEEKGLIDFSDFGDELKNGGKKQQQQQQQGGNNIDTTWTW